MTRKVFWEDPYRATLETRVEEVAGDEVVLAATIFYAFSGGQESDEGTIGGRPVLEARKDGARIYYRLAPDHGLRPGDPVTVAIDWERRYRLMRRHFAAEIVLELAYRCLGREAKIGAHIAADKARIDFATATSVAPLLPAIAAEANEIVVADRPIISAFGGEGQERRYWRIDGFATVPCGGTHLRRTGEIGRIALRRQNPGRGKERIEIRVGDGAAAERVQG